jgi:hypothetical protein
VHPFYNHFMARGWESKSVESQQDEAQQKPASDGHRQLTPEEQQRARQRQNLELARSNTLKQIEASRDPRYTELLNKTLADLEASIAKLR